MCANCESGLDGIVVAPCSSRPLVLYNRGDRCVWVKAESRPDCSVQPGSFLVPANSSKVKVSDVRKLNRDTLSA